MGNNPSALGIQDPRRTKSFGGPVLGHPYHEKDVQEMDIDLAREASEDHGPLNMTENKTLEEEDQEKIPELVEPPAKRPHRSRACTVGMRPVAKDRKGKVKPEKKIPTVFKWYIPGTMSPKPKACYIGGSFNNWELIPMRGSATNFAIIIDLPVGNHQYKFKVDNEWMHNPKEPTTGDGHGGVNNVIKVATTDNEVFEALAMDIQDRSKKRLPNEFVPSDHYGQQVPLLMNFTTLRGTNGPPILPPHLLQVILNKETPLSCEPTLLPKPNHVMINHLYALSIKDKVMVLSSTQRYKKKYVTTVLYRPI